MLSLSSHSYKCYLRACIVFSNSLFHIFSGPLFANVEGYVYLDLLVWGLSPLAFLFLRDRFFAFFRNQSQGVRGKTFRGIILLNCVIFVSYFFLNYSPRFNWNYFSRTFNIEVGYFIFDMLIRTFQLMVEVQEEKEMGKQCDTYCKFQHAAMTLSYFLVFYLSSTFDVNQRNNGPLIFALCSVFSFLSMVLIPVLYYCHHRHEINQYHEIDEEKESTEVEQLNVRRKANTELFEQPKSTIKSVFALSLLNVSLIINTNYFSLWMMEPLNTTTESSYQQYNITIEMVSGFFLASSLGYYLAYKMFGILKIAPLLARLMLVIYGFFIALTYWNYRVEYVSILILGFGFHQLCNMELSEMLKVKWHVDIRLYLKNEVFAYFIMPLVFMFLGVGQTSLKIYACFSGIFLALGAILL